MGVRLAAGGLKRVRGHWELLAEWTAAEVSVSRRIHGNRHLITLDLAYDR